jgi:hypothetical protein
MGERGASRLASWVRYPGWAGTLLLLTILLAGRITSACQAITPQ